MEASNLMPEGRDFVPLPLLNSAFAPGQARQTAQTIPDPDLRAVALAEYAYFSGKPEEAARKVEGYLQSQDPALKLSACMLYTYANLATGEVERSRFALRQLQVHLESPESCASDGQNAAAVFVVHAATTMLHLPQDEHIPPMGRLLAYLPDGLKAFALYVQAHHAYLQADYGRCIGIVETALALQPRVCPIPSIYLHLSAAMAHMSLRQVSEARTHLLEAWELAREDDLIEPFGEHHGLLGGLLEAVIKKDWPEEFKRIIAITYRFSAGWRKIHCAYTGNDVADNLTTTEFAVSMLAARGWTNQEIGNHMGISSNTVKQYVSAALQKLNIRQRKDLKQYMLK